MPVRLRAGALIGLAAGLLAVLAGTTPFIRSVDLTLHDVWARRAADPDRAHPDIAIVEIDETSLRRLEPVVGRWPWPRLVHAAVVDFLARAPAAVVAYDVAFLDHDRRLGFDVGGEVWTGAESDAAFVASTRAAGNVVHLADAVYEGVMRLDDETRAGGTIEAVPQGAYALDDSFELRPAISGPFPALADAARGLGHNLMVLDPDGPVRRFVPFVRGDGVFVPSLALASVQLARGIPSSEVRLEGDHLRLGTLTLPAPLEPVATFDPDGEARRGAGATSRRTLIRFRGPAVRPDGRTPTYPTFSFYDLFYSEQQLLEGVAPLVDPGQFAGRIVFVGATAVGLSDVYAVPLGATGRMAGPQVHANVADMILSQRFSETASSSVCAVVALVVSVLGGLGAVARRAATGLATAVLLLALVLAGAWAAFAGGTWVPVMPAIVGLALATPAGLAWQYVVEGREKRQVQALFSRYLSKDVYEQVLANPALAELGGRRRQMSVLFSDVRGFTALAERGDPEALVAQLNEYFSAMVEIVFAHQGTLDKFVGDMVMALFGAPLDDAWHADHAVETAVAMVRTLDTLNARWKVEGRPTLDIGIGINSGEMIAGNIGSRQVRSYTVIGDAVNLGARLESLNRDYGTRIIISDATRQLLRHAPRLRPLGSVVVKGRSEPVEIFEVVVEAAPA
jgi:adenylate cyclase